MSHTLFRCVAAAILTVMTLLFSLRAEAASVKDTTETVVGHPPVASPVLNNYRPQVGDTLTATSGFEDQDGDVEYGTTWLWQTEKTYGQNDWQDTDVTTPFWLVRPEHAGQKYGPG